MSVAVKHQAYELLWDLNEVCIFYEIALQALWNSILLSELRNVQLPHLRTVFQHITSVFVCDALLWCRCPTVGWEPPVWKPQSLKEEISCNKTISLSHKCGTQSKLFRFNSHLEQGLIWSGDHFLLRNDFIFASAETSLPSVVQDVVSCSAQAELEVCWDHLRL